MLTRSSDQYGLAIRLFSNVVPYSFEKSCDVTGVGGTPAGITAWLATLPNRGVSTPQPVTIGGLSGLMVDVSIGPTHSSGCDFAQDESGTGSFSLGEPGLPDGVLNVQSVGSARWFLLDRGDGRTLLVDVSNEDEAMWDAGLTAAMPIVNSFEFVR